MADPGRHELMMMMMMMMMMMTPTTTTIIIIIIMTTTTTAVMMMTIDDDDDHDGGDDDSDVCTETDRLAVLLVFIFPCTACCYLLFIILIRCPDESNHRPQLQLSIHSFPIPLPLLYYVERPIGHQRRRLANDPVDYNRFPNQLDKQFFYF